MLPVISNMVLQQSERKKGRSHKDRPGTARYNSRQKVNFADTCICRMLVAVEV